MVEVTDYRILVSRIVDGEWEPLKISNKIDEKSAELAATELRKKLSGIGAIKIDVVPNDARYESLALRLGEAKVEVQTFTSVEQLRQFMEKQAATAKAGTDIDPECGCNQCCRIRDLAAHVVKKELDRREAKRAESMGFVERWLRWGGII